jgi:vacuolar-type H+-ATPase subunit I/STV1
MIGMLCAAIPGLGLLISITGLICSLICKKKIKQGQIDNTGPQTLLSNIGLVTSIMGLIASVMVTIMLVSGLSFFNNARKMQNDMMDNFRTRRQEIIGNSTML